MTKKSNIHDENIGERLKQISEHMKVDATALTEEMLKTRELIKDYQSYLANLRRIRTMQDQIKTQNIDVNFQKELIKIMTKWPQIKSMRQAEVIYHVIQLKCNKEIACLMNVEDKTVRFHKTAIFEKIGVQNSMQLVRSYLGMDEAYKKAPSDKLPVGSAEND